MQINLNGPDGSPFASFEVPATIREVKLSQYIDFLVAIREFRTEGANEAAVMARAVSAFVGCDPVELAAAKFGGEYEQVAVDNIESVSGLYAYLLHLIGTHKPSVKQDAVAKFEYKGEQYFLSGTSLSSVSGIQLNALNVIEAVEAFEVKNRINNAVSQNGDPDGSLWFTEYLQILAILARKEGEQLPLDDAERLAFIEARSAHFLDIPVDIALDVDFFLLTGLLLLKITPRFIGSLTLPALQILQEVKKSPSQSAKPKRLLLPRQKGLAGAGSRSRRQKIIGLNGRT
jgi:hypothetical protein